MTRPPRPPAPARLLVLVVLVVLAGYGLAGCGGPTRPTDEEPLAGGARPGFSPSSVPSSVPSSATPTAAGPELLDFSAGGAVEPFIETSDDVAQLRGAPQSFKDFIGRAADDLQEQSDCAYRAIGFSVDALRTDGYAIGGVADCGGGAAVLWADADGGWQEIGATQEIWDCALLQQFRVPSDLLGGTTLCFDARERDTRPYGS